MCFWSNSHNLQLDDWVLCRIYKKSNSLSSVPPLMDQEQEDSGTEDAYLPSLQNITQENTVKLPKSSSISDLLEDCGALSHLFDTQPEFNSLLANPSSSPLFINGNNNDNGNAYLVPHRVETKYPSVQDHQNSPSKRQRTAEGCPETSKRQNDPCLVANLSSNQFDAYQYSFFNQQLLLNSHFGLHWVQIYHSALD